MMIDAYSHILPLKYPEAVQKGAPKFYMLVSHIPPFLFRGMLT